MSGEEEYSRGRARSRLAVLRTATNSLVCVSAPYLRFKTHASGAEISALHTHGP